MSEMIRSGKTVPIYVRYIEPADRLSVKTLGPSTWNRLRASKICQSFLCRVFLQQELKPMTVVSNESESSVTDDVGVPVLCIRLNESFDEIVSLRVR